MTLRVGIVAANAYAAIFPHQGDRVGGLENSAWNLARHLARHCDCEVQFVVRHTGGLPSTVVENVRLKAVVERLRAMRAAVSRDVDVLGRFPWMRVRRWRPSLLWRLPLLAAAKIGRRGAQEGGLRQAVLDLDVDVVLAMGVGAESAESLRAARDAGLPAALWLRANADLNERFAQPGGVDDYGVRSEDFQACVDGAVRIICQTRWQQQRLHALTGREGILIRNPIAVAADVAAAPRRFEDRQCVLWIGRYDVFHKRPLLFLDVARQLPEIPIVMIINGGDPGVSSAVRASLPPRVSIVDYVPSHEMPQQYRRARVFVSTGSPQYEGFPNVLLEAAAHQTPIASLEDFDAFLEESGAGLCAQGDVAELARAIRRLWSDEALWCRCAEAGPAYVKRRHSMEDVGRRVFRLLSEM